MTKITISYIERSTSCPAGTRVFTGKNITEASVLAANFQSRHPELAEKTFHIK